MRRKVNIADEEIVEIIEKRIPAILSLRPGFED